MTAPSHLSNVWFSVTPLEVSHGKGCWVTTTSGEEYLDFAAGIAVNSTGHAHPKVAAAIAAQAQRFIHAQVNVFKHELRSSPRSRPARSTRSSSPTPAPRSPRVR
jgi:4-aminobutyrate aminotransferase